MRGIITATKQGNTPDMGLTALIKIGGITLLERQVRILMKAGIKDVLVVATGRNDALQGEIDRFSKLKGMRVRLVWPGCESGLDLSGTFAETDDEPWMLLDGASIFDERAPKLLGEVNGERVALIAKDQVETADAEQGMEFEVNGKPYLFMGIAQLQSGITHKIFPDDGDQWLKDLLTEVVAKGEEVTLATDTLPTYNYDLRRNDPYYWIPIRSAEDNPRAKRILLNHAQKSVLDWPAWYIHRPIEKGIIYHLCETAITPNQLTLINNIVAFIGAYYFFTGSWFLALIFSMAVGILDGLDGKQARTKMMTSEFGRIEEVLDKIYENTWYLGMAWYLAHSGFGTLPYILFGIIFMVNMTDIGIGLYFKSKKHCQLDDFGPFERKFRVFSGRRNTYIWTLIPFVLFGALYAGYWMITIYALITLGVRFWRCTYHIRNDSERVLPE